MELSNSINLDSLTPEQLWEFWNQTVNSRASGRIIFPDRPRGYTRAVQNLRNYAANKATAMKLRIDGNNRAFEYEHIADDIYKRLPAFARLW